jgi:hypothetical protein
MVRKWKEQLTITALKYPMELIWLELMAAIQWLQVLKLKE